MFITNAYAQAAAGAGDDGDAAFEIDAHVKLLVCAQGRPLVSAVSSARARCATLARPGTPGCCTHDRPMKQNDEIITTPPVDAASVLLLRDSAQGLQVLLMRRAQASQVLGGAYVFPGGKLDAQDHAAEALQCLSESPEQLHQRLAEPTLAPQRAAGLFMAVLREAWAEYRDESFILQFLSPRLMRKLKLFHVSDDAEQPVLHVEAIHDEAGYRRQITELENQASFLRSLPSLKTMLGLNYDSNQFLYNNDWLEILGSGVIHDRVMTNAGKNIQTEVGWAFGLGLERWAMKLFDI